MLQEDLAGSAKGEPSAAVRERVAGACERQLTRRGKPNTALAARELNRHCALNARGATPLRQATSRLGLSARAYHRVLKVASTIADVAGAQRIAGAHIAEAIQYRRFDRG